MFPIRDHNPSGRTPYVTYALMLVNTAIFFGYLGILSVPAQIGPFFATWAMIPARLSAGEGYYTLVTSMFLHGGLLHLAGNMLFLWIFGDNLEDEMGHARFAAFYVSAGIGAGLIQYLSAPASPVPMVGASGAIAGVMGGYLLLFPRAKVDILIIFIIFFKILPIPAWIMLAVWFVMQFVGGIGSNAAEGGVAYWAHAGGFAIGLLLTLPLWHRLGGPAFWRQTHGAPPHPGAQYRSARSRIPKIPRR